MSEETTTVRCFQVKELRIEDPKEKGGPPVITGLGVPYNAPSEDLGGLREVFKPGTCRNLQDDIFIDVEHDPGRKLGRTSAKTANVQDDPKGLRVSVTVPDTTVGRDTLEEVRNGTLDGMSIAFTDPEDSWDGHGDAILRTITGANLEAVTLTSYPAFRQTAGSLALRSLDAYKATEEGALQEVAPDTDVLRKRLDLAEAED
jgi:HK97 family phage prohead protease